VIGIAGGSMVRVKEGTLVDVGPRSAHIAGLPYAAFADPAVFAGATLEHFRPKSDDPDDYVAVRCADGARYALTSTCAANVLGYAEPGQHAYGNPEAARAAMAPLAAALNCSIEEAARQILDRATAKAVPVVEQLIAEYGLDRDQAILVGEGGGAGALIPFTAERMGLKYTISKDAEVISSIGVALALVREVIERVIPDPQPEDIRAIKREAFDAVVRLGAAAENVEVTIEIDPHTQRVRATAMGASEMRAKTRTVVLSEGSARAIAAESIGVPVEATTVVASTDRMRVIQAVIAEPAPAKARHPVRAVDLEGVIRIQRSDARVAKSSAEQGLETLKRLWVENTIHDGEGTVVPDVFVVIGAHIVDLTGIASLDQAVAIVRTEFEGLVPDVSVVLVVTAGARR
jgi:N-methylhydantoinase A